MAEALGCRCLRVWDPKVQASGIPQPSELFFGSLAGRSEDAEDIANLPLERRDVRYCLLQRREEILKVCDAAWRQPYGPWSLERGRC
eukprot:1146423-Pelagomonas_calceolata.AAC.6